MNLNEDSPFLKYGSIFSDSVQNDLENTLSIEQSSDESNSTSLFVDYNELLKEFKKGDLLYGIAKERNLALHFLENNDDALNLGNIIIDDLNTQVIHHETGRILGLEKLPKGQVKEHFLYLERHKYYSPSTVPEFDEQKNNTSKINTRIQRINRSCKGGVLRIIESKDNKVHFVLKGFNPISAFNKEGEKGIYAKPHITNSEFRLIFRLWKQDRVKVDSKIIFWNQKGQKVLATEYFQSLEGKHNYEPSNLKTTKSLYNWSNNKKEVKNKEI